jgi:hypothetical protein
MQPTTYEHTKTGLVARWAGGAYIDLYIKGQPAPFDCINVWNDKTDTPTIRRTAEALADRVDAWVADLQNNASEEK